MSNHSQRIAVAMAELLDEDRSLSLDDLARACFMRPEWVTERVTAGLLEARNTGGSWQFTSSTVVRARRLARLESTFEADPQLAALTTDLLEEVASLRQRLRQLEASLKPY